MKAVEVVIDGKGNRWPRALQVPPPAQAEDGTSFTFWRPYRKLPGRGQAKWSCYLGATIRFPDGSVENTWGKTLNGIFRNAFGVSLLKWIEAGQGESPP